MPTVEAPNTNGGNQSQFQDILTTFTSLTDPLAIHSALLVLDHALQGANASEATQQILSSIPLSHFLQLLETDHGNDTELTIDRTCNVIESLLRDQSFSTISQDSLLHDALLQALNAAFPRVHALGLSQVDKIANENISVLKSMLESDVFKATVEGIASESIAIAERSKQTLLKICKGQDRLKAVVNYDPSFYLIRNLATSRGSVVQLRMIEALASLAGESQESLNLLESMGLLDSLKNGLGAVDILTRFNIIEILSEFGATKAGSQYLDQSGILKRLGEVVQFEVQDDELGTTAIIKLYGKLGSSTDIDFIALDMKYQILSQLQWILVGSDDYTPSESLQVEAMATFGLSGGNIRNLEWVCDSSCASTFIGLLSTLRRDSKVGWYHSLAQILACSSNPSSEIQRIISNFYSKLEEPGQSPFITRLLVSAKSQTTELSMSALTVMISLARYPFGVQNMGSQREVISFLLDRNAELSHPQKVAKFEVIEAVLKTYDDAKRTSNTSLLMNDQVSHLDLIRRQGPFYQRATATVAIQDIAA